MGWFYQLRASGLLKCFAQKHLRNSLIGEFLVTNEFDGRFPLARKEESE